jgi:hypothetical protein
MAGKIWSVPFARARETESGMKNAARTAKRMTGSGMNMDVTYREWPSRGAMLTMLAMQDQRPPRPNDWHAVVPVSEGTGWQRDRRSAVQWQSGAHPLYRRKQLEQRRAMRRGQQGPTAPSHHGWGRTKEEAAAVAATIRRQIGPDTLAAMGARDFVYDAGRTGGSEGPSLAFTVGRAPLKKIVVTLTSSDLYDVRFVAYTRGYDIREDKTVSGLQAEQLSDTVYRLVNR